MWDSTRTNRRCLERRSSRHGRSLPKIDSLPEAFAERDATSAHILSGPSGLGSSDGPHLTLVSDCVEGAEPRSDAIEGHGLLEPAHGRDEGTRHFELGGRPDDAARGERVRQGATLEAAGEGVAPLGTLDGL